MTLPFVYKIKIFFNNIIKNRAFCLIFLSLVVAIILEFSVGEHKKSVTTYSATRTVAQASSEQLSVSQFPAKNLMGNVQMEDRSDAITEQVDHSWAGYAAEILKELFILGFLVFVWEKFNEHQHKIDIRRNQNEAIKALIFFVDEKKDPSIKAEFFSQNKLKSRFAYAVDSFISKLELNPNVKEENFPDACLVPFANEQLFINLESSFSGIQDIIVEGNNRDEATQNLFIKIYKEMRMLSFLSERTSALMNSEDLMSDQGMIYPVTHKKNILNVLIGLTFSLNRMHRLCEQLKIRLSDPDVKPLCGMFYEISDPILARLYNLPMPTNLKDSRSMFEVPKAGSEDLFILKEDDSEQINKISLIEEKIEFFNQITHNKFLDARLLHCKLYFEMLRDDPNIALLRNNINHIGFSKAA